MTVGVETNQIIVRLKQRAQGKPGSRTARQRQEEAARNARVNKMLISMVVIFGTSWCPINLINLAADTVDLSSLSLNLLDKNCKRFISGCWELYYLAFFITHVIAMSSICYNPFLYGWMNTGIGIVVLAWVWFNINQNTFKNKIPFLSLSGRVSKTLYLYEKARWFCEEKVRKLYNGNAM